MSDNSTARYRVIRQLGRGGMGEVDLVEDTKWKTVVARKRILIDDPDYLLRFKREFRDLEALTHPNLVQLFELAEDDDGIFFTMEVVDGWELHEYCRDVTIAAPGADTTRLLPIPVESQEVIEIPTTAPAPILRETGAFAPTLDLLPGQPPPRQPDRRILSDGEVEKTRHVLPQILDALEFLHSHGIVHRDLKPPNILVARDGTVKLLDFGIAGHVGKTTILDRPNAPVGTIGFMSPEQIRGEEPTPQTDLYALGAVVWDLLAARPLFDGPTAMAILVHHLQRDAPSLEAAVVDPPSDLSALCAGLLARDLTKRLTIEEARQVLAIDADAALPGGGVRPLVGRAPLQQRLETLLFGGSTTSNLVVLFGPTGMGKSALLNWAYERAGELGVAVFRGRARARDRTAFNAVDQAIDELALSLRASGEQPKELLSTAAATFPVLATTRAEGVTRASAFDALSSLLCRDDSATLLLIDDLQWADDDSLALLEHVAAAAPNMTIVATLRDDIPAPDVDRWLESAAGSKKVRVGPLDDGALAKIAKQWADGPLSPEVLASCAGSPFLAELAGRTAATRRSLTEDALHVLFDREIGEETMTVALILAAEGWVDPRTLADLLHRAEGDLRPALIRMEHAGIVRSGQGRDTVDIYHDAVRRALDDWLNKTVIQDAHLAHANHLRDTEDEATAHRIARHFDEAGSTQSAVPWALKAASRAEQQLAWSLAADMWALAARGRTDAPVDWIERHAKALDRAGRYREGARAWQKVASQAQDAGARNAASIRRGAALLGANDIEAGYAAVEQTLARGRGFRGRVSDAIAAARFLAGPSASAARSLGANREPQNAALAARAEEELRLAMLVAFFDPLHGLALLMRVREELIEGRCHGHAAWCDYLLAYIAQHRSAAPSEPPLARRYLDSANAMLGERDAPSPLLSTLASGLEATTNFRVGELDLALGQADAALRALDEAGLAGTFEYMYLLAIRLRFTIVSEDVDALDDVVNRFVMLSRRSEHFALVAHMRFGQLFLHTFRGEFEAARAVSDRLDASLARPTIHKVLNRAYRRLPDIWDTDCHDAALITRDVLKSGSRFRVTGTLFSSVLLGLAALVEANALRGGSPIGDARRVLALADQADTGVRTLPAWCSRARAYVADHEGDPERAVRELREAARRARVGGQQIDHAIAEYQLGLRLDGDEGARLVEGATHRIRECGASDALLQEDVALR